MQAFMRVLRRYAAHIHQIDEYRTSKVGSGSLQAWGHSEIVGRRLYAQPGFTAPAPQVCSACGHRPLRLIEPHMATRSRDVQACPGCGTFWVSAGGGGNLSRQPVSRSDSLDRWTCMTHTCPPPRPATPTRPSTSATPRTAALSTKTAPLRCSAATPTLARLLPVEEREALLLGAVAVADSR